MSIRASSIHRRVGRGLPSSRTARRRDQPAKLWDSDDLEGEFFASPVYIEGNDLHGCQRGSYALEAHTGRLSYYEKELALRFSAGGQPGRPPANLYPSVTLAGKRLLVGNDAGETLVLQPGEQYKEACRNTIDNGSGASLVPDGARLFLRAGTCSIASATSGNGESRIRKHSRHSA